MKDLLLWFIVPVSAFLLLLSSFFYYKSNYCKEVPCLRFARECIKSHIEDNGRTGKYHRAWEICDEYREYYYESVFYDCGIDKIK